MAEAEDIRKFEHFIELNDPSDSVIKYETNDVAPRDELEKRLYVLIQNYAVRFRGPDPILPEDKLVEASFYPEWRGKRKLVYLKGINGSYITSADARHGKGGRAETLRYGRAIIEIKGYEYAIELGMDENQHL
jgi:hypothetical protein